MTTFTYDEDRAINAVLWFLKRHGSLDHIKLLKLIVFADVEHLKKYGRPIVGGPYFAMEHGPVSSVLYDELKLLSTSPSGILPGTEAVNDFTLRAVVDPNEEFLSETDLEVLRAINEKYGTWDRFRLSTQTHKFEAWEKNYKGPRPDGRAGSYPIPYKDFVDECLDETMAAIVEDDQQSERILG